MAVRFLHKVPICVTLIDTEHPDVLIHKYIKPESIFDKILKVVVKMAIILFWLGIGYGIGVLGG